MNLNPVIVPLSAMVCYLALGIYMLLRRRVRSRAPRSLLVYLSALVAWNVSFAYGIADPTNSPLAAISRQATIGGLVILVVVFLNMTHAFLRETSRFTTTWLILGFVCMAIVVVFSAEIMPLGIPSLTIGNYRVGQNEAIRLFSILVWAVFATSAALATWRVYRETPSPTYRNRYRYWLLSLTLLAMGDAFSFTEAPLLNLFGIGVKMGSTMISSLAVLRHELADVKSLFRQAFSYAGVALFSVILGLVLVWASTSISGDLSLYGALIGFGATSVILALATHPMRRAIQRIVDRRVFHADADYEAALRAYGDKVIETLELEPLAELVMDTLTFTTRAGRGGLYLIREGKREIGGLLLDPIKRVGDMPAGDFELHPDGVLAARLTRSIEPLTRHHIDFDEECASIRAEERNWLDAILIEILIPIHTQSKLVGLFALGAKGTGESYSSPDIEWLKALANQTAVALQNARLFDQVQGMSVNMMRLNADLHNAYQQLQEVDQLKSTFIGMITHELRSPFVAAGFSVQLLHRYAQEGMLDELREQTVQLDKELGEGRRMIDNVISFASLLSKQGEMHLKDSDIAELVHSTLHPLRSMAKVRSLTLVCNLSPQCSRAVIDPARVGEALYHLVHNAIKFNRDGGSVRVSCWATDTHIVFKVEDTGHGIPPEKLEYIWDAFTQAADNVRRGVEGMGLGLALVKFVVDAHRGEVWATSKLNGGSTFGFRIPKQPSGCSEAA